MLRDSSGGTSFHPKLLGFAQAVASRPFSEAKMEMARTELTKETDEEALVEAAATGAFFELTTKIVDVTGKVPGPPIIRAIISFILSILRFTYTLFWR